MPIQVLMPALSPTMEKGNLAKWHVKVGDTVKSGDVIAEIETDKATMEVEAVDEGVVETLLVPEGTEEVKVNTPIARLSGGAEAPAANPPAAPLAAPAPPAPVATALRPSESGETPKPATGPSPRPTPAADAEVPPGTQMKKLTVRDALRDAMAEEMRRDD